MKRNGRLAALERTVKRIQSETARIPNLVEQVRREGASWTEIGLALGVSKQAAWRKYRDVNDGPAARDQ